MCKTQKNKKKQGGKKSPMIPLAVIDIGHVPFQSFFYEFFHKQMTANAV